MDSDCNAKAQRPCVSMPYFYGQTKEALVMICEYCGAQFEPKRKNNIFCCKRCKDNASKARRGIRPVDEIKKICPECGKEFITVYTRKVFCSAPCKHRAYDKNRVRHEQHEHTWAEYTSLRKAEAEKRREEKERERIKHTIERKCAICGSAFSCLDTMTNKTCSPDCSREYAKIRHKKDKRIPKDKIIDRDINLKALYKRDGGRCYICGRVCDFNDWINPTAKNRYPGKAYPEIDHVIPVSRGGEHSWANVRLACRKCNEEKSDNLIIVSPLDRRLAYSQKRKGNPPKRTAQYTLDGELLKVWDSTEQIKKELGISSKYIQNVCRGEGKSAYGFKWAYVV